nr:YIP1 family protein [uncultured Methanospirillum sp.]
MLQDQVQIVKGLLVSPVDTFEELRSSAISKSYQYYVLLLIIYTVLVGIISATSSLMTYYNMVIQYASIPLIGSFLISKMELLKPVFINMSLFSVYLLFLLMFFGIFIKGFFLHAFVLLFGGEQGITKTIQVLMYSVTPFFLIGWIPYISIIGLLWAVILCVLGFHVFQQIPVWKAALVVVIPTLFVILGLFLLLMVSTALTNIPSGIV